MTRPTLAALAVTAAAAAAGLATAGTASAATAHATKGAHTSKAHVVTKAARTARATKKTYTVRTGDSFWSIAHHFGVNWYNLAADNHLEMYSTLHPGQRLVIPAASERAHAPMPLSSTSTSVASSSEVSSVPTSQGSSSYSSTASTSYSSGATSGFQQCVISRESGGNADAWNASGHWGLYQFSASTWAAYGGNPSDFGSASAAEQNQVFNNAVASGGESNWAPYDGC